jgi:hypothetical protein
MNDLLDNGHGRRPMHSRRTWSHNGTDYSTESYHHGGPGFSFEVHTTSASSGLPRQQQRAQQNPGLLGTAFGLLGNALANKVQRQQEAAQRHQARSARQQAYADPLAYGDEDGEDIYVERTRTEPRTLFGRLAEGILSGSEPQRQRRAPSSKEETPRSRRSGGRGGNTRSQRRHRTDERRPSWTQNQSAYVEDETDSMGEESDSTGSDYDLPQSRKPRRAFTANDAELIQTLEAAKEYHRREKRDCRRRIETASRQGNNFRLLQRLVKELSEHEKHYEETKEDLRKLQENAQQKRPRPQARQSSRQSSQQQSTRPPPDPFAHPLFADPLQDPFAGFFQQPRRNTHHVHIGSSNAGPFGDPFAAFDQMFHNLNGTQPWAHTFFGMPQFTFTTGANTGQRTYYTSTGPQFQPNATFANPFAAPAQPRPPSTLLKPEEAKVLFQTYNERWNGLATTDPNIPYPARGLKASTLLARDSIWAPGCSDINTWSDETVMKANAQAFFLGVAGLSPQYNECTPTGKMEMGYNKTKATPAQVKELIDILKKEKIRWHSDRLGRRNGGVAAGTNEKLQSDERARAVFHAVCELMDVAQGA